jgi:hypothetical protein
MKIKTSELAGAALDWAVGMAIGEYKPVAVPSYSTDWSQGGPIIELEKISTVSDEGDLYWQAVIDCQSGAMFGPNLCGSFWHEGPTPLIAAMRCYVASKLGDEVEVPEELK